MATNLTLSKFEQAVLNVIQHDFPLNTDPYAEIALKVASTPDQVHATVLELRHRGIIRRIGGSFAAKKMGYVSILVAARVAASQLDTVAAMVSNYPEVTHNYQRSGCYNLWFTIIAKNDSRLEDILAEVGNCHGVEAVYALPATRTFKIRVDFKFGEESKNAG